MLHYRRRPLHDATMLWSAHNLTLRLPFFVTRLFINRSIFGLGSDQTATLYNYTHVSPPRRNPAQQIVKNSLRTKNKVQEKT